MDAAARSRLRRYAERLVEWNRRLNLTAIVEPGAIAELHLVDSLAVLRTLGEAGSLLDIGSGAGLPGVALACARPGLDVTCCDSVQKKVAFVKAVAAELDLSCRARAVRAAGHPDEERLPRAEAVVSRAFADPGRWLPLAASYLAPGGKVFAMLGRRVQVNDIAAAAAGCGLSVDIADAFSLPRSGASRTVVRLSPRR